MPILNLIRNFGVNDSLTEINKDYQTLLSLKNNLSENSSAYSQFEMDNSLEKHSIRNSYFSYEKYLLIQCYTFSEQLLKNLIYEMLNKDNLKNDYLKTFVENKIPENRYVPNVKFNMIPNEILKNTGYNFFFLLNNNNMEIKKYNDLVDNRNKYAHSGSCAFNFENFEDIINLLYYISFEYSEIINKKVNLNNLYKLLQLIIYFDKKCINDIPKKIDAIIVQNKMFFNKNYEKIIKIKLLNPLLSLLIKLNNETIYDKQLSIIEKIQKNIELYYHKKNIKEYAIKTNN